MVEADTQTITAGYVNPAGAALHNQPTCQIKHIRTINALIANNDSYALTTLLDATIHSLLL
jgi:hypothetical protein